MLLSVIVAPKLSFRILEQALAFVLMLHVLKQN